MHYLLFYGLCLKNTNFLDAQLLFYLTILSFRGISPLTVNYCHNDIIENEQNSDVEVPSKDKKNIGYVFFQQLLQLEHYISQS